MLTKTQTKQHYVLLTASWQSYGEGLSRYAISRTHNPALTDDLVQNTFFKTWKYLARGGKIEVMEAFLYHVLKALIIDEYRKRKSMSLDTLLEEGFEPAIDETERIINTFDGRQVATLVSRLPRKYQKVIRLRYLKDLSLKEIASITGQSRNTTAVQLHRGLEKLRALHEECM